MRLSKSINVVSYIDGLSSTLIWLCEVSSTTACTNTTGNRMNLHKVILIVATFSGVVACAATPRVFVDYHRAHDFNAYKRFAWLHDKPAMVEGNLPVPKLVQDRFSTAIKQEFIDKGFQFVEDRGTADFVVAFTIGARDDIDIHQYASEYYDNKENWLWGTRYHQYIFPLGIEERVPANYTKGVLAIDIYDSTTKSPVWHSKASKRLEQADLQSGGKNAKQVAQRLLASFPP